MKFQKLVRIAVMVTVVFTIMACKRKTADYSGIADPTPYPSEPPIQYKSPASK